MNDDDAMVLVSRDRLERLVKLGKLAAKLGECSDGDCIDEWSDIVMNEAYAMEFRGDFDEEESSN